MMDQSGKTPFSPKTVVLGSQSLGRKALLSQLYPTKSIQIVAPLEKEELSFDALTSLDQIKKQIKQIAHIKSEDVQKQLVGQPFQAIVTADTIIVGFDENNQPFVMGKPPYSEKDPVKWKVTVQNWFQQFLLPRPHQAISCVQVVTPSGKTVSKIVTTVVEFASDCENLLPWYLETGESLGKAGGYAAQGLGSIFINKIEGSLSNIIGLPLRETRELIQSITT